MNWTVIDEAHHIFPVDGSQAMDLLPPAPESFSRNNHRGEEHPPPVIDRINTNASTELEAVDGRKDPAQDNTTLIAMFVDDDGPSIASA